MKNIKKIQRVITNKEIKEALGKKSAKAGLKAAAVHPDAGEVRKVIEQKLREQIDRQKRYRATFLNRIMLGAELEEIRRQLDAEEKKKGSITMMWRGIKCPKDILSIEHDIQQHNYGHKIAEEEYLKQSLKNDGLSDEDIKKIASGRYIKLDKDGKKIKETKVRKK